MQSIESIGQQIGDIPVEISYKIIQLFSDNLYRSPYKALEELVSNSYDAMATRVDIVMSADGMSPNASIWVVDDGEGMDENGLKQLWRIAESTKRVEPSPERPPIGRFGIGKLATYALANRLTHIASTGQAVLAVTMDFEAVGRSFATETIDRPLRQLSPEELREALAPLRALDGGREVVERLLAEAGAGHWTVAAMTSLRAKAAELREGRTRWLLSRALPMSPRFKLWLNGREVESAKLTENPAKVWEIGVDDDSALGMSTAEPCHDDAGPGVRIAGLDGVVRGHAALYGRALDTGKSEDMGRSNGFFVTVRERLINEDDELFGLEALSHGSFARFRMEVSADGLDDCLTSGRESVRETTGVRNLRDYLKAKFNEARVEYDAMTRGDGTGAGLADQFRKAPGWVTTVPLLNAVKAAILSGHDSMYLADIPRGLPVDERRALCERLDAAASQGTLVKHVKLFPGRPDGPLVSFDPASMAARVNMLHPFVANFLDQPQALDVVTLFAVAELLSEGMMLGQGISRPKVRSVLERRGLLFRELATQVRVGPVSVAQTLKDSRSDEAGLEKAVGDALSSLGLRVTALGKSGNPDGIAVADLGAGESGQRDDYRVVYDAKSSGHPRISARNAGIANAARHRDDLEATHAIVVAPGFEGADRRDSALGASCVSHDVVAMDIDDLARLVLVAPIRYLGLRRLRELFEKCRTPLEAHKWVESVASECDQSPPVREVLEALAECMKEEDDPVTYGSIATNYRVRQDSKISQDEVRAVIASVATLAPGYLFYDSETAYLEVPVERVLEAMSRNRADYPPEFMRTLRDT